MTGAENSANEAGIGSPANPVHYCTKKSDETDTTKWSYVYFGGYPQSEVTDSATIAAIDSAISEDSPAGGSEGTDVLVNGVKYRRISISDTNNDEFLMRRKITVTAISNGNGLNGGCCRITEAPYL